MAKSITTEMRAKVCAAAERLKAKGGKTTNDAVRAELGGGSLADIVPVMRVWRADQEQAARAGSEVPSSVQNAMAYLTDELWKAAEQEAEKKTAGIKADCDKQIATAEEERDEALGEVVRLEAEGESQKGEIETLREAAKVFESEKKKQADQLHTSELICLRV